MRSLALTLLSPLSQKEQYAFIQSSLCYILALSVSLNSYNIPVKWAVCIYGEETDSEGGSDLFKSSAKWEFEY